MRLSIFLQIGFLALTALFLALTVYYYPIPSMGAAMLVLCGVAGALNAGSAVGGIASGAGCLSFIVIFFGVLYGFAWLFFGFGA